MRTSCGVSSHAGFAMTWIVEDGTQSPYSAMVIERVFLPPAASGGGPFVRRTLIAWNEKSRRALSFSADDDSASLHLRTLDVTQEASPLRIWGHLGLGTEVESGQSGAWVANDGTLTFTATERLGRCGLPMHRRSAANRPLAFSNDSEPACEHIRYRVGATATMVRQPSSQTPYDFDVAGPRRVVVVTAPSLVGTRIVAQCPEPSSDVDRRVPECNFSMNFWRSQSSFVPSLGIDVSRLVTSGGDYRYLQIVAAGTGPAIPCCRQFNGVVQYRVTMPDGRILRTGQTVPSQDPSFVPVDLNVVREGSRVRVIVPARRYEHSASSLSIAVMDLSLVPCPAGLRRNDTSFPGNAYPDGGCDPPWNFPKP